MSRLGDALVIALGLVSVTAVLEMAIRPFYGPPPLVQSPQVRFRHSGRLGWEMVPDPSAHSLDQRAPINERGLRGDLVPYERSDSLALRWLILGGGTAFGVGVGEERTFARLVAASETSRLSRPVNVINLGCEGHDLYQSLRFMELEGWFYQPDLVLLVFEPADLPAEGYRDSAFTPERFEGVAGWLNRAPGATFPFERLKDWSRLLHFLDGRVRSFLKFGGRVSPDPHRPAPPRSVRALDLLLDRDSPVLERAWDTVAAEMARIGDISRSAGAKVCLIALPLPAQLRRHYPRARYQTRLLDIAQKNGFMFVDPLQALREERRQMIRVYLPRLPYLNERGHRVLAQAVADELILPLAGEFD